MKYRVSYSPPASELPGQQTYVRDDSPSNKDRTPESVLSPDKATPRSPTRPDSNGEDNLNQMGPTTFNVPDGSAKEVKTRTRPAEGEQYGHPYNDGTSNVRVRREVRTAMMQTMASRVADRWLKEAVVRVRQRPHVKPKGLFNTRYKRDRPRGQQNSSPAQTKIKKKRWYRRNKVKVRRKNKIRYKRKYKGNPRWKKTQQRRKKNPQKHVRRGPNKSLLRRNNKKHQQNYRKRKRAMIQSLADRYMGVV